MYINIYNKKKPEAVFNILARMSGFQIWMYANVHMSATGYSNRMILNADSAEEDIIVIRW